MVAKVISGKTIRGVISYNENKVKEGTASCICARGFAGEAQQLSFADKLNTFEYYTRRNAKVVTNAVHISLNFDPREKLDDETLISISSSYLGKIGFGHQPYLVYRHFDAAHPHVHIVTTNIQLNGRKISLNNIGRDKSEAARKEIEVEFSLIRAQGRKLSNEPLRAIDIAKAVYGKSETKRAISNIVNAVTRSYRFTSIHELNAVLKQFNVMADPGKEGTIIHSKNGLRYTMIDESGNPVGIPIKASSIYGRPTLKRLSDQFDLNETLRAPHKERIKSLIDAFMQTDKKSLDGLVNHLVLNQVYPVIRQNEQGRIYGLTFIDHATKCVFNGSALGKEYSAKGILDRFNHEASIANQQPATPVSIPRLPMKSGVEASTDSSIITFKTHDIGILGDLTKAEVNYSNTPYQLKKKRKKKGRSI